MCLESGSVCGWDNAQRKQMPDHKEVEQSGSGRNRASKAWFCQCWSIRDTTPHPMGNRSCCWFCRTMSFVYPLVAQKSFFGRLYDLSFLEHVCMKFRTRTDWWNCGLILFFFLLSTMRLDVDMETQAFTKIDDSDLWFETNEDLGGWNKLLMVIRIFLVLGLNSYRHHRCSFCPTKICGQPTMWEPMVDTGSHLTVGIYCKLFRLCSLGEAKQYEE